MQRVFRISGLKIGQWLKAVLIVQALMAALLITIDLGGRWRLDLPSSAPEPNAPVSPGDQVRRYDPNRMSPQIYRPGSLPEIELQSELPPRLDFTLHEDPKLGALVVMHGPIEPGDAGRLDAFLDSLDQPLGAVAINSPGGVVGEALSIGRSLRERELDTLVLSGMYCFSSCPYVLAGGISRRVSENGLVGLHQHYYETPGYMPVYFAVEDIQRGQGETLSYLIEMGIDPAVMVHGLMTPPDDIYVLVESELLESGFATEVTD